MESFLLMLALRPGASERGSVERKGSGSGMAPSSAIGVAAPLLAPAIAARPGDAVSTVPPRLRST
jgi:hypothetical protein